MLFNGALSATNSFNGSLQMFNGFYLLAKLLMGLCLLAMLCNIRRVDTTSIQTFETVALV